MDKQNSTSILRYGNILERKTWMMQGLIEKSPKSFWSGLIGNNANAVIYQKNDFNAQSGQTVVFDYKGYLATEGFRGKEQAFGKAPPKLKFSDKLTLEFGRYTVDNGNEFDAATIGDIDLSTHADSRSLLGDLFTKARDQMFFDLGQGYLNGQTPSHTILPNGKKSIANLEAKDKMSWDFLIDVETIIRTGQGYTTGERRAIMKPFELQNGDPVWIVVLDPYQLRDLLKDPGFQNIYKDAEVRGVDNVLISHKFNKFGSLLIMSAGVFAGTSPTNLLFKQRVEVAGLRHIDQNGTFSSKEATLQGKVASRGLVLGAGAFQLGVGAPPDYRFQPSQDFNIVSESALCLTMQVGKCRLTAEVEDYKDAKVADMDYGVAVIDTYNSLLSH